MSFFDFLLCGSVQTVESPIQGVNCEHVRPVSRQDKHRVSDSLASSPALPVQPSRLFMPKSFDALTESKELTFEQRSLLETVYTSFDSMGKKLTGKQVFESLQWVYQQLPESRDIPKKPFPSSALKCLLHLALVAKCKDCKSGTYSSGRVSTAMRRVLYDVFQLSARRVNHGLSDYRMTIKEIAFVLTDTPQQVFDLLKVVRFQSRAEQASLSSVETSTSWVTPVKQGMYRNGKLPPLRGAFRDGVSHQRSLCQVDTATPLRTPPQEALSPSTRSVGRMQLRSFIQTSTPLLSPVKQGVPYATSTPKQQSALPEVNTPKTPRSILKSPDRPIKGHGRHHVSFEVRTQ